MLKEVQRGARFETAFRACYVTFNALRNLGFSSEDIHFGFGPVVNVGSDYTYVQLQTQGKTFTSVESQLPGEKETTVLSRWQKFCHRVNLMPEGVLNVWVVQGRWASLHARMRLMTTLRDRGFEVPAFAGQDAQTQADLAAVFPPEPVPTTGQGGTT